MFVTQYIETTEARPIIPVMRFTEARRIVLPIIDPMAMVMAMVKLDILEKLLFPAILVKRITVP